MIVGGSRGRLDDEDVLAADVLLHLDENLHVREAADDAPGQRGLEVACDRLGKGAVAIAGNQFHCGPLLKALGEALLPTAPPG